MKIELKNQYNFEITVKGSTYHFTMIAEGEMQAKKLLADDLQKVIEELLK